MSLLKNFGKVITACKKEYRKKRFGEFRIYDGYSEDSRLCFGDNEDFMKFLLNKEDMAGKIQQIYIDPPFFSKATYDATVKRTNADGDEIKVKKRAYEDIWEEGMEEYLKMMGVRLMLMRDGQEYLLFLEPKVYPREKNRDTYKQTFCLIEHPYSRISLDIAEHPERVGIYALPVDGAWPRIAFADACQYDLAVESDVARDVYLENCVKLLSNYTEP